MTIPRSKDRGLIEAKQLCVWLEKPVRIPRSKDRGLIEAAMRVSHVVQIPHEFRDQKIAASLKLGIGAHPAQQEGQFRDQKIAASLKL